MDKTIEIDKKKIKLKSTGATPLIYRNQFNRDYFADLMGLSKTFPSNENGEMIDERDWTKEQIEQVDLQPLYNFLWSVAKNADSTIPEPIEWFGQFDSFSIVEIMPEIQDLLMNSVQGKKN